MIFSSKSFIFIFLPLVFLINLFLNRLKNPYLSKIWLILASFYFYAQGSFSFFPFFLATVIFNFGIGTFLTKFHHQPASLRKKNLLFALGLAENLLLLAYFKYTNFFIQNINGLFGLDLATLQIILPIGISFFTFQLIAYLMDCYRNKSNPYSFLDYLLFVTFFPQLIIGPIVHHKDIIPQFENANQRNFNWDMLKMGIVIFSMGCGKKVLLADPLTAYAKIFFTQVSGFDMLTAWLSSIAYTFSYYFDLSGYADMAIGLGYMFNIKLPQNFNSPYKARNFSDYWKRWHMTLSKFLSDYVFRTVYKKGSASLNFYIAVLITFLVSGFWHGASWNFVVWGLINGIFVCSANFMERKQWKFPFFIAWTLTFIGIIATRIIFVSNNFSLSLEIYQKLFDFSQFSSLSFPQILNILKTFLFANFGTFMYLSVAMGLAFFGKTTENLTSPMLTTQKYDTRYAIASGILLTLSVFQMSQVVDFLYFKF